VHAPAPLKEYFPARHSVAVAFEDPAGHAYPAVHEPVQLDVVRADVAPYTPAGQTTQLLAPTNEYLPGGHATTEPLVEPGGQMYPAEHTPEHVAVVAPEPDPKYPAAHTPLHADVDKPLVDPYVPGGHETHTDAPPRLYVPGPHTTAVALVDPEGHTYPAAQSPEQLVVVRPEADP
jgi:hypothetical protein